MKKIFIVWLSYMLFVFIYSEYKRSLILSSVEHQSMEQLFSTLPQEELQVFNSTDSLAYLYGIIRSRNIEINSLIDDSKKYNSFKNQVIFPMTFPVRMLMVLFVVLFVAYFSLRNKKLHKLKIMNEYETKYRNIELQNSMLLLAKRNEDIDNLVVQLKHLEESPTKEEVELLITQLKKEKIIESN